jgi:2-haloacid dehalogenase
MTDTWALFDLNGTLVDIHTMADPLGGDERARALVERAFEEMVRNAMVRTLSGRGAVLRDLLRAQLARALEIDGRDAGLADACLEAFAGMRPYPDAEECLQTLRDGGVRVAVLTQSAAAAGTTVLEHAGLLGQVEQVLSAEATGAFKPDGRVYAHGVASTAGDPARAWMVAAHWWDIAGAGAAGMRTAWVSRDDRVWPASEPAPDVQGASLLETARALVAATGR